MLIHSLPSSPHNRFLEISYALTLSSPGVGGKNQNRFRLGAVIINSKNHILSAKTNLLKTHPKLLPFFTFPYLHAEAYAILSLGLSNCQNKTLYICRIYRNNHIALAKPCESCQKLIEFVRIKQIIFTTETGFEIKTPHSHAIRSS